ncbi:MAG TPA: class I SAM-dependent RNA methyltransferase [Gemmatimonadaceae bacterium]
MLFVSCAPGLEPLVSSELDSLGLRGRATPGGVEFNGGMAEMFAANLWLRTASRVLISAAAFHASSFHELERRANQVPWETWLPKGERVRFRVTCRKSRLYHSDAVAERLGNAAAKRANAVASDDEDAQLFVVRIFRDECTIRADSSGELLHRRGYRQSLAKAPLRETLASAMLLASEWDLGSPLIDPFCGSGTIPIEAALMARRIAPGITRSFAFQRWPSHDQDQWNGIRGKAREAALQSAPAMILASDRDEGAVRATIENAERAGVAADIDASVRPVSAVDLPSARGWVVTNPPYGVRIGERGELRNLYAGFGNALRRAGARYRLAILSADRELEAQLRLDLEEVLRTTNGGIPVRLLVGEIE